MSQPTPTRKWTYADYLAIPDDGKQHQIIGGEHFVTAAPRYKHQMVLSNLHFLLAAHVRERDLGHALVSPVDFVLTELDVVQPDVFFISKERLELVGETHVPVAPDLAIEVLSPSTRKLDQGLKRELYERHGVREYWIVDPERETVQVLRRAGGLFEELEPMSRFGWSRRRQRGASRADAGAERHLRLTGSDEGHERSCISPCSCGHRGDPRSSGRTPRGRSPGTGAGCRPPLVPRACWSNRRTAALAHRATRGGP